MRFSFSFEFDVKYDICVIQLLMFLVFCLLTQQKIHLKRNVQKNKKSLV